MKTNTQPQSERVVGGRYRLLPEIGMGGTLRLVSNRP